VEGAAPRFDIVFFMKQMTGALCAGFFRRLLGRSVGLQT